MTDPRSEPSDRSDEPISVLAKRLTEQTAALSRQELRLAQLELLQKGKAAGLGAGLLGAGGVIALLGLAAGLVSAGAALAIVIPVWAAALTIAVMLLFVGGISALAGGASLRKSGPPVPDATVHSLREDAEVVRRSAHR